MNTCSNLEDSATRIGATFGDPTRTNRERQLLLADT